MAEGRSKIEKGRGEMAERVELTWEAGTVGGSESCKLVGVGGRAAKDYL